MVWLFARHDVRIGDTVRVYEAAGVRAYVDKSDYGEWVARSMEKRGWRYVGEVVWSGKVNGSVYGFGLGEWERAQD